VEVLTRVPASVLRLGRRTVNRVGLDVTRHPFPRRLVRMCATAGIDTVADVGANIGQYGRALRSAGFAGRIVSCEPMSAAFAVLDREARRDPRWQPVRTALGSGEGFVSLNIAGNSHSSSVLRMLDAHREAAPGSGYVAAEEVPLTTVDELFARCGIDPGRSLLKIDVQGYERAVLDGAAATLPGLAAVQVELSLVPLYEGQSLMPEIGDLLAGHGLRLWAIEPGFSDPRSGRMLQCDGVFLRE
jgi:FkbM family methyltransferase